MKPRKEGVDFLNLDNREDLVFKAFWLRSKGNESIVRRLKRDEVANAFEMLALAKQALKGGNEGEPEDGGDSKRMTVRMCSKAAESLLRVVGTISNGEGR